MLSINAVSIAPVARDWLLNSRHPRVLHIFDRACNLINERREVLSIVTPQIGNGPFNLVIEDNILFTNHLVTKSPIFLHIDQVNLGGLAIDASRAQLWNPCPDWGSLHTRRDEIIDRLKQFQITYFLDTSLWEQSLVSTLSSSLASLDISKAKRITSQLAGLGIGLTPAGDDHIIGALLAVWIIHSYAIAQELANEIAETAAPLTTSLSAAWLRSVGRGEAGISWHRFFDALLSKDQETIQESVDTLLAIGHTSGADALAGFIGTIFYWSGQMKESERANFQRSGE